MFSNTVDMIAFAEAIQNNKLLSASKTREWMKPQTHTSSAYFSVGAPWEILRSDNITSDGRLIDVYTKTGDLGLYHAVIGIVPDYDISVSVLTGGLEVSATVSSMLLSAVIEATLPVVEAAGRDEASRFEGTYSDKSTNSTLVLTSDSSPGLVIKEFQVRGFDVLHNFDSYNVNSAEGAQEQPTRIPEVDGRLYPTKRQGRGSQNTEETAWRAVFDSTTEEDKEKVDSQLFYPDGSCTSWFSLDRSAYNYHSLADFVIVEGSEGDVKAVKNRAFNVTLTKVSDGNDDGDDDESDDGDNGGDGSESVPENPADMMRMMGNSAMFVVTMLILVHFL